MVSGKDKRTMGLAGRDFVLTIILPSGPQLGPHAWTLQRHWVPPSVQMIESQRSQDTTLRFPIVVLSDLVPKPDIDQQLLNEFGPDIFNQVSCLASRHAYYNSCVSSKTVVVCTVLLHARCFSAFPP